MQGAASIDGSVLAIKLNVLVFLPVLCDDFNILALVGSVTQVKCESKARRRKKKQTKTNTNRPNMNTDKF